MSIDRVLSPRFFALSIPLSILIGCSSLKPTLPASSSDIPSAPPVVVQSTTAPVVFTMNNDPADNAVLAFSRTPNGTLVQLGKYSTGGKGTGGGLGNQAALALSTDRKLLFVVNAGSNDFTVFQIGASGLTLASRTPSGGARPISISEYQGTVFVLNLDSSSGSGHADSISGFRADSTGAVTPIPNSTRPLSAASTTAAQVAISPDGKAVLVTERGTAVIDGFAIDANGIPSATAISNQSAGTIPFGFQFLDATHVLVSEEGPNAASSYSLSPGVTLSPISRSIPSHQTAVCWLAITPSLRFAYTGNTSAASISGYSIAADTTLKLLQPNGLSAATDGGALDLTASADSKYLYVVTTTGNLQSFNIAADGSLSTLQTVPSLGAVNGVVSL